MFRFHTRDASCIAYLLFCLDFRVGLFSRVYNGIDLALLDGLCGMSCMVNISYYNIKLFS